MFPSPTRWESVRARVVAVAIVAASLLIRTWAQPLHP